MREIDFNNRLIFGNIFVKKNDSFVLLNLLSFRRMYVSQQDLETLLSCKEKRACGLELSAEENTLYNSLIEKKQIIDDDLRSRFIEGKAKEYEENIEKITNKIGRITISPTFACNFNCTYCYQRKFQSKKDFLCADAIDNICQSLRVINRTENYWEGITEVSINGGEPLQPQNIDTINRIIHYFAKPGIELSLLTNGYNILKFKDKVDFSKFTSIQVSLDNIDPYTSKINGVNYPVFREVLDGLSYLMKYDCLITVAAVLTEELFANIDEFIEGLDSIGIVDNERCQINITPITAFGKSTLDKSFYSIDDFIKIRKGLRLTKIPRNMSISGVPEARWISRALARNANERIDGRPSMCSIFKNRSLHFAPDGKIYWCLCVKPNTGTLGQFYPSVDVDEIGIDKCIHKSIYSNDKCKSCEYQFLCSSGCPLHCVAATGDYDEPFCGFFFDPDFWRNLEELI